VTCIAWARVSLKRRVPLNMLIHMTNIIVPLKMLMHVTCIPWVACRTMDVDRMTSTSLDVDRMTSTSFVSRKWLVSLYMLMRVTYISRVSLKWLVLLNILIHVTNITWTTKDVDASDAYHVCPSGDLYY